MLKLYDWGRFYKKIFGRFKIISYLCNVIGKKHISSRFTPTEIFLVGNDLKKEDRYMGIFFNNDKKDYCGRYKGIDVWQYGCMIGNNWYGDFYVTIPRGATKRNMKVKDSVCRSLEAVKGYIDRNLETLKKESAK